jgi:tRNA (guanine-N7-)-methyltransferase
MSTKKMNESNNDNQDVVSQGGQEEDEMNKNNKRKEPTSEDEDDDTNNNREWDNEVTPITSPGHMPQKRFYRQRAHCNPLSCNDSFHYPVRPDLMDWTKEHYPGWKEGSNPVPTVLDIGCGFGGLTVALSTLLPEETILGMEIRAKVTEFVRLRILALRKDVPGSYQNASVMRTNSMKYLPNYFPKGRIKKIFFCFPDPHFKRKNYPRRIVSERLLSEYAYLLAPGEKLYTITDVKELHEWHVDKCNAHPLFERIPDDSEELSKDPCVHAMKTETEEGKKVARNGGNKFYAVYRRIPPDDIEKGRLPELNTNNFFDPVEEEKKDSS